MTDNRMAASAPQPQRGAGLFWVILIAWVMILGLALGIAAGLTKIYRGEQILSGVTALGRDLGAQTPTEATNRLHNEWASRSIILVAGGQSWTLGPDELGVLLDADATVRAAQRQGRGPLTIETLPDLARRLAATSGLLPIATTPLTVPPIWHFDREAAANTLRTLAGQVDVPRQDAGVRVVDGRLETSPAVVGRALDIASMLTTLETHPWQTALTTPGATPRFALPIVDQPPAITDVSALVEEVRPLLANPITIVLYDAIRDERIIWTVTPAEMGRWLTFEEAEPATGEGTLPPKSLTWHVTEESIAAWLSERNKTFGDERYVDARPAVPALAQALSQRMAEVKLSVSHDERQHVVKEGETLSSIAFDYGMPYPWIQAANPGVGDALFVGDRLRIPSVDALLPLPVVENKRIVINLAKQRMQAYEDGALKWDWIASTGIPSSPTSPGIFQVQSHEELAYAAVWDLYMPWFMGIYRPVPGQEFMNGFHGFPSRDRKQFLWERNLGHPITYGCILISTTNARLLYDWAEVGVVVDIRP